MAEKHDSGELSFVGPGTTVEGKIRTDGSIRIDGKLVGELFAKSNAAVGINGIVEGAVAAKNGALAGKVHGTVTATEKLILEEKSVMKGDICASRLVIDEGAMFDGNCAMSTQPGQSKSG